jgi:hypothetical protein
MTSSDDLLKRLGERARARAREAEAFEEIRAPRHPAAFRRAERIDGLLAAIEGAPSSRSASARPRRLGWRWSAALVPFAVAAVVALAVRAGRPVEAPVGDYTFAVSGRVDRVRSASDDPATVLEPREGALQQVIVRPREAARAPVAAQVLLVGPTGAAAAGVEPEVSDLGVVRFDVPGERLRGASEVRVVIAPPAELASAVATVVASASGDPQRLGGGAVVVRVPVEAASEKK